MKKLILLFFAFAFSQVHADPVLTPLIKCTPPAGSPLFRFVLTDVNGCVDTPAGSKCGDYVDMKVYGMHPVTHRWTFAGYVGEFPNTAVIDKTQDQFGFHFAKPDGSEFIDIEKSGSQTVINIKLNISFKLVPKLDTSGDQTTYACTLLE